MSDIFLIRGEAMRTYDIIHRVEKGDTLAKIAAKYGVPQTMIARDNELTEEIYEGQRLIIGRVEGTVYSVRPEDTLESIAQKFGVDKEEILKKNNIKDIYPFMSIVI